MTLASHIRKEDQDLIEEVCQITITGQSAAPITRLIERFRQEVQRADSNADELKKVREQMHGMDRMVRIYAEARR